MPNRDGRDEPGHDEPRGSLFLGKNFVEQILHRLPGPLIDLFIVHKTVLRVFVLWIAEAMHRAAI
jgi:hypothetical protein